MVLVESPGCKESNDMYRSVGKRPEALNGLDL